MKPLKSRLVLGLLLLSVDSTYIFASEVSDFKPIFDKALVSNSKVIEETIGRLDQTMPKSKQKGGLLVFRGSLQAKIADLAFFPWDKIGNVNSGISSMKQGIEMAESDTTGLYDSVDLLTLRLSRGITSGYIPSPFQSPEVCVTELERCLKMPEFGSVVASSRAEVLALLSRKYQEKGETEKAQEFKMQAITIDKDTAERILKK